MKRETFVNRAILTALLAISSFLESPILAAADDGPSGKIIADSGFRPKPHGFSFENWGGDEHPHSNLTAADAVNLFGDRVCARWEGDECVPTPAAKLWLDQSNEAMKGGHCEGMAAMSSAFFVKQESPTDYGAPQPFWLKPHDPELMTTISSYFVTQGLEPVMSNVLATKEWPLKRVVDFIAEALKSKEDFATLGIFGPDGGHAITPPPPFWLKSEPRGSTESTYTTTTTRGLRNTPR